MNRLSLFDGMSCGQIAFNKIGVVSGKYYAAEIDKYAIKVTQANYPNTIQLGSVTEWREWDLDWSTIDFVSGGFPCQAWSMAGKQLGDKDDRGMLFWVMLDIIKHAKQANPKIKFLIENVKMKKEFEDYITHHTEQALGEVNKALINSALVSAQNRKRFYWTNWRVEQPEDKGIVLTDVIEPIVNAKFFVGKTQLQRLDLKSVKDGGARVCFQSSGQNVSKSECLQARDYKGISGRQYFTVAMVGGKLRKLTPIEYERLQCVPDNYTNHVSNTQRYKMLGNGWTVDVIAHILSQMQIPVKATTGQLDMFGVTHEN
jgi:site-specific DNA-cytosine methylase